MRSESHQQPNLTSSRVTRCAYPDILELSSLTSFPAFFQLQLSCICCYPAYVFLILCVLHISSISYFSSVVHAVTTYWYPNPAVVKKVAIVSNSANQHVYAFAVNQTPKPTLPKVTSHRRTSCTNVFIMGFGCFVPAGSRSSPTKG